MIQSHPPLSTRCGKDFSDPRQPPTNRPQPTHMHPIDVFADRLHVTSTFPSSFAVVIRTPAEQVRSVQSTV